MIAKIDESEIFRQLRVIAGAAGCIFILSMAAAGFFMFLHLRLRRTMELRLEQDLRAATRDLNLRIRELKCCTHYGGRRRP